MRVGVVWVWCVAWVGECACVHCVVSGAARPTCIVRLTVGWLVVWCVVGVVVSLVLSVVLAVGVRPVPFRTR